MADTEPPELLALCAASRQKLLQEANCDKTPSDGWGWLDIYEEVHDKVVPRLDMVSFSLMLIGVHEPPPPACSQQTLQRAVCAQDADLQCYWMKLYEFVYGPMEASESALQPSAQGVQEGTFTQQLAITCQEQQDPQSQAPVQTSQQDSAL